MYVNVDAGNKSSIKQSFCSARSGPEEPEASNLYAVALLSIYSTTHIALNYIVILGLILPGTKLYNQGH